MCSLKLRLEGERLIHIKSLAASHPGFEVQYIYALLEYVLAEIRKTISVSLTLPLKYIFSTAYKFNIIFVHPISKQIERTPLVLNKKQPRLI